MPKTTLALRAVLVLLLLCSLFSHALAQSTAVAPRITAAIDERNLVRLPGNVHPLARPQFDQGAAPPDLPLDRMLLVLKRSPDQQSALQKLLDDQHDRSSASFHKWLTPDEFGQRFGIDDTDIQNVSLWLTSHGLRVSQVARGRTVIEFSGTASQVQEAFHTSIHKYVVNGEEHWANSIDPAIPAALTPAVAGVFTLHDFTKKPQIQVVENAFQAKLSPGKAPQVTFPGNPPRHALSPADFAKIYNFDPNYQPQGALLSPRIAIVARTNINTTDLLYFADDFPINGINGATPAGVILNGPDPGDLGGIEEAEAVLDASWSGALIVNNPSTKLLVVSASTNTTDGVDLSELYIIENNFADIMTESFGDCEANFTSAQASAISGLAEQAAAQGITYIVSAGDSGAEGCDDPRVETVASGPLSVNLLASTPYTIAVGGTTLNESGQDSKYWSSSNTQFTFGSALSYIPEDAWNDSCAAAVCGSKANIWSGSGGPSTFFPKPSWQSGVPGIPNDGARDLPDVSFSAGSHDPYLICLRGSCVPDAQGFIRFAAVWGTSAAAPSFAGVMALVDLTTNSRQGQANYVMYKLATGNNLSQCNGSNTGALPTSTCLFNDVTVGNIAVPGESGYGGTSAKYQSGTGYDLATGLGSVNIMNLLNEFGSANFDATSTSIVSVNPTSITHGQPVNIDVQVTSNAGTPTGKISLVANNGYVGTTIDGTSIGLFPLTAGSFSSGVSTLPGGAYTLTAMYEGDGTFAPSTSSPSAPVTVNPEPSTTTLTVLGYPAPNSPPPVFTSGPYGSFVYLRADVAGQSQKGIPTGMVGFSDPSIIIPGNPYALNSEGNTASPNGIFVFPVGSHTVTAAYGGDASFSPSNSQAQTFTITPAATTTAVTGTGAPQGVTFTATVGTTSGGNPPTGSVLFTVNGVGTTAPLTGTPAVLNPITDAIKSAAQSTATFTASNLAAGQNYSVTAGYSGDGNYLASSGSASGSVQPDFGINASPSSLTITPGQSPTFTVSITSLSGYAGTVNLAPSSCSGLPSESSCSFSLGAINGSGTTLLTIATMGPHQVASVAAQEPFRRWGALMATVLIGLTLSAASFARGSWNKVLLLVLFAAVTLVGCGTGNTGPVSAGPPQTDPGTHPGIYTVIITASSGSITHTTTVTLTVD